MLSLAVGLLIMLALPGLLLHLSWHYCSRLLMTLSAVVFAVAVILVAKAIIWLI